ncbi:MAG: S41 family peptidase, partial [Terriglobia bacterium]
MSKTERAMSWVAPVILLCALSGLPAQRVTAPQSPTRSTTVPASLKEFSKVLGLVEANYADPVDPDLTIYGPSGANSLGAIPAMLRTLDPHS